MTAVPPAAEAAALAGRGDFSASTDLYYVAIAADPTDIEAHRSLRMSALRVGLRYDPTLPKGFDLDTTENERARARLVSFYDELMERDPTDAIACWGRGGAEDSYLKQEPWFRKAIALDPGFAPAYVDLATIALLRGDDDEVERLLTTAAECSPDDPALAMRLAVSTQDLSRRATLLDRIAQRFDGTEDAVVALVAAADAQDDPAEAKKRLMQLRDQFPPDRSPACARAMTKLLALLEKDEPADALRLASEMAQLPGAAGLQWSQALESLRAKADADTSLSLGDGANALAAVAKAIPGRPHDPELPLMKAAALASLGRASEAVQDLVKGLVKAPDSGAARLAAELSGTTVEQLWEQVWARRDELATAAPDLSLAYIDADDAFDLHAARGTVVWVSFFYPGCGPCRHEFPYLQRIVDGLADRADFLMVAVNGVPEQRSFSTPLLRSSGCTFRALDGGPEVNNDWDVVGFPANFLIGRDSRILYQPRVYDDSTCAEAMLQVTQLLARATS